jgi:GNAT superfamily N-acetyltransferase
MIESTSALRSIAALEALLEEVNQSPFIGALSLAELQQLLAAETIRFTYVDDELVGFGAWVVINDQWAEIGPFYMVKRFRGQGLGKQIMEDVVVHVGNSGRNLYAVTRNTAVDKMLQGMGFRRIPIWRLPPRVLGFAMQKLGPRKLWGFFRKHSPGRMRHLIKTQSTYTALNAENR